MTILSAKYKYRNAHGLINEYYYVSASPVDAPEIVFQVVIDAVSGAPVRKSGGYQIPDNYIQICFRLDLERELHYAAPEDIHIYSIDEAFIDCTRYLSRYRKQAASQGLSPAHVMARTMIQEVLDTTGITATVGIGTNLYLAKIAMDIVAKKAPPDEDGVRIAELDERSYCELLWDHTPLTDFWGTGVLSKLMTGSA